MGTIPFYSPTPPHRCPREDEGGGCWKEANRTREDGYDLKEISLAGAHGGPIVGLIALIVRKFTDWFTGEKAFREAIGSGALEHLEAAKISEEYKNDLRRIIGERIPRTF